MDAGLKARERYRPWLQLGLRHILLPENSTLAGSYADLPVSPTSRISHAPMAQPSAPVFPRRAVAGSEAPARPHSPPPDRPPQQDITPDSADPGPDWTSIWRRYRSNLKVPSRVVWTYFELGFDLGDSPDNDRRFLFAKMIKALKGAGWPNDAFGFWPVAFQCRGALEPRRELFQRGLRESGAHTALCFGAAAQAILFDNRPFVLETTTLGDTTVIVLPGPEDMLGPDAAQAKRAAWERLKAYNPS